jgi:hydrogenase maturation protein HypF
MCVLKGRRIHIAGIVQGVGFRPFVYHLAVRHGLRGWVCNTLAGVDIEVGGSEVELEQFIDALTREIPALVRIDLFSATEIAPPQESGFVIRPSVAQAGDFQPVAADIAMCQECRREMTDPANRRYRYPFINCSLCGPRFTLIKDLPYDRPLTTMASFEMCSKCFQEYSDPENRRFHAQPIACPSCGPQIWYVRQAKDPASSTAASPTSQALLGDKALREARQLIGDGGILALKGIGGFHLVCDASNPIAVSELRRRKGRVDKPFAVMLPNLETVEAYCELDPAERTLLRSVAHPIVLLNRRPSHVARAPVAACVAPGQSTLGAMLPYSPLHTLLSEPESGFPNALVVTSGNLGEEPICRSNDEALCRLAGLADGFLLHNREIHVRCDDSVVRTVGGEELPIRRSRGYAPFPVKLPVAIPSILATGAELKNTFCITRSDYAFLSHHIGDMENFETLSSFEQSIRHFEKIFRIEPQLIAHDHHPDYLSTSYALQRAQRENIPSVRVQHHHAHIAACMAENELTGESPVLGVVFDGIGYGTDGAIWGGEFLLADYRGFERLAHLAYVPLPGGDTATRRPYRTALSYLQQAGIPWTEDLPPVLAAIRMGQGPQPAPASVESRQHQRPIELAVIARQLQAGVNCPLTSSMGRLFDAVASIIGVRQEVTYEGQAASELEAMADSQESGLYPIPLVAETELRCDGVLEAIVQDLKSGTSAAVISGRFHNTIAAMVLSVAVSARKDWGVNRVVLSGGVFQNVRLLRRTLALLQADGFEMYRHRKVPPNDGGLSLGQALIAASVWAEHTRR